MSPGQRRGHKKDEAGTPRAGAGGMLAFLAVLSAGAIAFFYNQGCLLYYGDAAAHVNIARRITDSRTPGWEQIGTVWLPLPHLLMLPLVRSDWLWRTGLAGSLVSGVCFVAAGLLMFLAARRVFGDVAAGAAACLLMALNPNLLYLQSIPMTESLYLACLAGLLYFTVLFRETQSWGSVVGAGVAAFAGTLTRYEGWFLIPFATAYFLIASREHRVTRAFLFGTIASLGPLLWLAHNYIYYGNALEFYSGGSSAQAIYQRALKAGLGRYPGDHDWHKAVLYVRTAIRLCAGQPLVVMGLAGAVVALLRRSVWPLILLVATPAFYVWSLHSGGTPLFVPPLWPRSYYNTRYAIGALPLLAFAAAALVAMVPARWRAAGAVLAVLAAISPWVAYPHIGNWICWKESQVNSEARRGWTRQAADYLRANYRMGDGILTSFGDVTGIYQQAGIPLAETLTECNGNAWLDIVRSPNPVVREGWIVAIPGSTVARLVPRLQSSGTRYDLVKTITQKGAPGILIYRRKL